MNSRGSSSYPFLLSAVIVLLLSACLPVNLPPSVQPTQAAQNTQSPTLPAAQATQPPTQPTQSAQPVSEGIVLDITGVAGSVTVENVPAAAAGPDSPWWAASPAYRRLTLAGYPLAKHESQPQIFIYPAADLAAANPNMGKAAADLQTLLQDHQDSALQAQQLPYLPLNSAAQVIRARVQYLDFKNGRGIRYLTQYNSGLVAINNVQAVYTFQGLTSDGKYYIAAVLPINHPDLAPSNQVSPELVKSGFQDYLTQATTMLNERPANTFTPDLDKLDAMMQSIEVK